MSRNLISRRAGVLAVSTVAGVLTMACPAMADVTVDPPSAPQGSGQNLYFTVTNTGTSALTRVKVVFPTDTPVAEGDPLSVDNWAPNITWVKPAAPLTSPHSGAQVNEATGAITWTAMPGHALPPRGSAKLGVAVGPLPGTSSMKFTVQATYADGRPGPAIPPVTLSLTPAAPGQKLPEHSSHGGTATTPGGDSDLDAATLAALAAAQDDGPGFWTIAGWVLAGLALLAAGFLLIRGRRSPGPADVDDGDGDGDGDEEEQKEPVSAGAPRVTSWRYQDGPE